MEKRKKGNKTPDVVKASRKLSREEEIRLHGKPIGYLKIEKSKKMYNRKKNKADTDKALPYFLYEIDC